MSYEIMHRIMSAVAYEPWSRPTWGAAVAICVLTVVVTLLCLALRAAGDVAEQTRDWRDPHRDDANKPWDHGP